jgi:hypothetical protein
MAAILNRVVPFTFWFVAIHLSASECSENYFLNSSTQAAFKAANGIVRPNLRRCISLTAEMTHEAAVAGNEAHDQSQHTIIYSPVHSPAPLKLRKDCLTNMERTGSQKPSEHQTFSSGIDSLHRNNCEEYTQLQTQLFPLIRF